MIRVDLSTKSIEHVLCEMVDLCDRHRLPYAVMGGIAVRVHGIPRPTFDVDFELSVDEQELAAFFDGAKALGYTVAAPFRSGWRDAVGGMPVKLATYITEGRTIDVDVFLNETPFQQSVMDRRQQYELLGRTMRVVSPEDLVLLKLLANRPRDLGDVADILFVQGQLDHDYMKHWAVRLGVSERLSAALIES